MDKYQWLKEAMNGETINELANKAGISSATAWRQFNNDLNFTAENVILIARAYHKDPVEALVAFDYLREDERGAASLRAALKNATNDDLLTEIAARLDRDPSLADQPVWRGDPKDLDRYIAERDATDDEIADTISKLGKPDVGLAAYHGDHKLDDEGNDAA
ncbi:helix-turn-helix domain-containing protein [Bifidobacterium adolescentis]|uniref:helix-turn-helix domain-containing protein n=1 Tax=Bifidobacterium adolescentis TaxID=1680 RepID=UPI001C23485B|nr:helix-turn-helix transcriptional regulator [Bifidobacterium adolescentis]MBU9010078.1 helix-turn-helix domain-containing protein [Bifidobacterium adolescentis]MBU9080056.1 helix-turn-helix domain-containing protein [Bifidobacterium adolescentis]MBU9101285.1 helix-turn-helix domain-containing protein [Bifidobacterium adolescentis]MBU9103210.1 helix-turn-helix domain-containing protein [Bifidobacterium adolescentis]